MTRQFSRERINPLDYLEKYAGFCPSHITFDPGLDYRHRIVRSSRHDGTYVFTHELIRDALSGLVNMQSYYKGDPLKPGLLGIRYTLGWIRIATVFGEVELPCGRRPGVRERVSIPVRCEPIYWQGMV